MRENIVETWAYYHLPVAHHKHLKSTNMLERFHQEIKHSTRHCHVKCSNLDLVISV